MALTIGQTIQQLHRSLRDYIEATYHVSNPMLVDQRRQLLEQRGVIHQQPYLESTPRYKAGEPFAALGLDPAALGGALLRYSGARRLASLDSRSPVRAPIAVRQTLARRRQESRGHDRHWLWQDRVLPFANPREASARSTRQRSAIRHNASGTGHGAVPDECAGQRSAWKAAAAFRRPSYRRSIYALVRQACTLCSIYKPHALSWRPRRR